MLISTFEYNQAPIDSFQCLGPNKLLDLFWVPFWIMRCEAGLIQCSLRHMPFKFSKEQSFESTQQKEGTCLLWNWGLSSWVQDSGTRDLAPKFSCLPFPHPVVCWSFCTEHEIRIRYKIWCLFDDIYFQMHYLAVGMKYKRDLVSNGQNKYRNWEKIVQKAVHYPFQVFSKALKPYDQVQNWLGSILYS